MAQNQKMQHGDATFVRNDPPDFGHIFSTEAMQLNAVPANPYEVNFCTPVDVISLTYGSIKGERQYDSDKRQYFDVLPFSAAFHPAGTQTHVVCPKLDAGLFAIALDKQFRTQFAQDVGRPDVLRDARSMDNIRLRNAPQLLAALDTAHRTGFSGGRMEAEALGLLVLSSLLSQITDWSADTIARGALPQNRLDQIFDLVEDGLDTNLSLTDLASEIGLTPYHFSRAFKAATGLSPHQYVLERRLIRARSLLIDRSSSLVEVAYAVGFSSQAHMTDVFRKKLGVTPGQYRKSILD